MIREHSANLTPLPELVSPLSLTIYIFLVLFSLLVKGCGFISRDDKLSSSSENRNLNHFFRKYHWIRRIYCVHNNKASKESALSLPWIVAVDNFKDRQRQKFMGRSPQRGPTRIYFGPLLFDIFINDLFLFIEKCNLHHYADDNTVSYLAPCLSDVLSSLQSDCNCAIEWFTNNGMKANPDKFQFMILSSSSLAPVELVLDNSTCIISQDCVKVLGITIDKQLNFNEHISLCCTKAARQLNAFARIFKYLNLNSRRAIHHSFIASNFGYCPLVWHFCGKTINAKLEKFQERSLRILCKYYTSSYEELLRNTGLSTLLLNRLKCLLLETSKTIWHME